MLVLQDQVVKSPPVQNEPFIIIAVQRCYCFPFVGNQYDSGYQGSNISHRTYYIFKCGINTIYLNVE